MILVRFKNIKEKIIELAPVVLLSSIATRTVLVTESVGAIDLGVKAGFVFLCIMLLAKTRKLKIEKNIAKIIALLFLYALFPLANSMFSDYVEEILAENEKKDIIRIYMSIVIIILTGLLCTDKISTRRLALVLGYVGAIVGVGAIHHSMTGSAVNAGRYITTGLIRAGSETSDSNALAGFLNLSSFMLIYLLLDAKDKKSKMILMAGLIICQIGRTLTFSTGGVISFLFSVILVWLINAKNKNSLSSNVKSAIFVVIAGILVAVALISSPNLQEILFSRFDYDNKYIYESSIGSRMSQFSIFYELITEDITNLIVGMGYAATVQKMGLGFEIHNVFLRVMSAGGMIGLIIYVMFLKNLERVLRENWTEIDSRKNSDQWQFSVCVYAAYLGWVLQALTLPVDVSVLMFSFVIIAALMSKLDRGNSIRVRA